jgi:beta-lactamase regulating signal transducer with metallopeptidase domain
MNTMTLGTSTFLVAVGAIMRYAVSAQGDGFDVPMIGGILMIVGIAGAIITLVLYASTRRRTATLVQRAPGTTVVEEREVVVR